MREQSQRGVPPGGTLVIDAHGHGTHVLPRPVQAFRRATVRSHPADSPLTDLAAAGVDAVIANAVGDRLVTRWRWPADPWAAVCQQLDELRGEAEAAGCRLATTTADIQAARDAGRPAVVLGLEGADVVGENPPGWLPCTRPEFASSDWSTSPTTPWAPPPCHGTDNPPARRSAPATEAPG